MAKDRISEYSVGERIKFLREQKRALSQSDLAREAQISRQMVHLIEAGERLPRLDTFIRIADALDVHPTVLLMDDDVHIFDMKRLKKKYKSEKDLNDNLYRALNEVIRYAKRIGLIDK